MTHRLHSTACESYYRVRSESRIVNRDERMVVISRNWAECSDKNQISLINILGRHGYGCGKVRTRV
jgi:hypothetical protein